MTSDWAIALNGFAVVSGCSEDEFCLDSLRVIDGLNDTPDGLDLPGIRNEDVTYYQRDGRKMFSDWYEGRTFVARATIGPDDGDCPDCVNGRSPVLDLAQAWKRSMVNQELVVYPPCEVVHSESNAYPPDAEAGTLTRTNLAPNPGGRFSGGWAQTLSTLFTTTWDDTVTTLDTRSRKMVRNATAPGSSIYGGILYAVGDDQDTIAGAIAVTPGTQYTGSFWIRVEQAGYSAFSALDWYDGGVSLGPTYGAQPALTPGVWTRLMVTGVAPVGADTVYLEVYIYHTDTVTPSAPGDTAYVAAAQLEVTSAATDYFDGATEDVYDDDLEGWYTYAWTGTDDQSTSTESFQDATFAGTIESGPYGIVGRPRAFLYKWVNRKEHIAEVVMRFEAIDQRMFILDECGTPGTGSCVEINPGSELFVRCYSNGTRCYSGSGRCYPTPADTENSVLPEEMNVGGTERVFPTITLYGDLISPVIENITTGESLTYAGTISGLPITINTEEGTAFDSEGTSQTHLLRGNTHLSMDPGNYELRLLSFVSVDDEEAGHATVCWRDTVVVG